MLKKNPTIKEFDTSYEYAYRIEFENINRCLFVSRNKGSILFGKSSIGENVIDGFELRSNNGKTQLLLHTTDDFGAHTDLIGEIDDKDTKIKAAEAWVDEVNQFYENGSKNKASVEAVD